MIPGKRPDDPNQHRIEREERHVGSLVATGCDVEIVDRVPAAPNGKQHVRGFLHVTSGALSDDNGRELGNDDDRHPRRGKVDQDLAYGLVETRRNEHLAHASERNSKQKEPGAVRKLRRQDKG